MVTIWNNRTIQVDNTPIVYRLWIRCGIYFINDLFDDDGAFLQLDQVRQKFSLATHFLEYHGLMQSKLVGIRSSIILISACVILLIVGIICYCQMVILHVSHSV